MPVTDSTVFYLGLKLSVCVRVCVCVCVCGGVGGGGGYDSLNKMCLCVQ